MTINDRSLLTLMMQGSAEDIVMQMQGHKSNKLQSVCNLIFGHFPILVSDLVFISYLAYTFLQSFGEALPFPTQGEGWK